MLKIVKDLRDLQSDIGHVLRDDRSAVKILVDAADILQAVERLALERVEAAALMSPCALLDVLGPTVPVTTEEKLARVEEILDQATDNFRTHQGVLADIRKAVLGES